MPYVSKDVRDHYKELVEKIRGDYVRSPGELNYLITHLCLSYLSKYDVNTYSDYNAVIGALEACKLEFYRKVVVDYEDLKAVENGEVYEK